MSKFLGAATNNQKLSARLENTVSGLPRYPGHGSGSADQDGFYKALVLNSPVAIATLDLDGKVVSCNPAFERMFGYLHTEVVGKNLDTLIASGETYYEAVQYTRRIISHGEAIRTTGWRKRKDGSSVLVELQGVPVVVNGETVGVLTIYNDVTERMRAEEALRDFYRSFVTVMDSIDADVYVADIDTYEILFMNQHMQESFHGDLVGEICYKVFRGEDEPCQHCTNSRLLDNSGKPVGAVVWEGQNPLTGRWYKNSDRATLWGDGHYVRVQVATDITELKEAEQRLEFMATHDPLTGLPNRMLFQTELPRAIQETRLQDTSLAVLFLDLDEFKAVNDRFGHRVGDLLLIEAAARMRACLRKGDLLARVSGDEFTFILREIRSREGVEKVAQRIIDIVGEVYEIAGQQIHVSASLGVSIYPHDGEDAEQLLQFADEAMYRVKERGRNNFCFYGDCRKEG